MTLDELLDLVEQGRDRFEGSEVVDDRAHALQTAALAHTDGADDDLLLAALLHDIGHHPVLCARFPGMRHEQVAAAVLAPFLEAGATFAVREHVAAKRHLAATEPGYLASLSPASAASLQRQGGAEVLPRLGEGHGPLALRLRRWDDRAKVLGLAEPAGLLAYCRALVAGRS